MIQHVFIRMGALALLLKFENIIHIWYVQLGQIILQSIIVVVITYKGPKLLHNGVQLYQLENVELTFICIYI